MSEMREALSKGQIMKEWIADGEREAGDHEAYSGTDAETSSL